MKKWIIMAGGIITGAALGFVYWHYVGCISGTCPITSSPVNSTIYGAVMGFFTTNLFSKPGK